MNTLPCETEVRIRITTDGASFESSGTIIYVQENVGMGIGFVNVEPKAQSVLDGWLAQLARSA